MLSVEFDLVNFVFEFDTLNELDLLRKNEEFLFLLKLEVPKVLNLGLGLENILILDFGQPH